MRAEATDQAFTRISYQWVAVEFRGVEGAAAVAFGVAHAVEPGQGAHLEFVERVVAVVVGDGLFQTAPQLFEGHQRRGVDR